MKDELRSESQAEMGRAGKIRQIPFFCPSYLSAILPPGREAWTAIKPSPTTANQSRTGMTYFYQLCASTSQTQTLEQRTEARLAQEGSAWQVGSLLSPALSSTSVWRRGRRGGVPRETHGTATGTVALPNHADTEPGQKRSNRCFGSKCRQIVCSCFTINALQPKGRPKSFRPISTCSDLFRPKK